MTTASDVTTRIVPPPIDVATIAAAGARYEDGHIGRIVVDRPTDHVNAIDPPLIAALGRAIADAREARPRGLVIVSAKPDQFVAGADLTMLANWPSAAEISQASREIQRIFGELAALPFPTVAAINGSALGGGYELALACDWRIAADAPSVRVGLPEVSLGLLPAAGGTQRLPRLVGLPRSLDQILNARRSNARRALRAGLVDEVVHPAALERAAFDRAKSGRTRRVQGGESLVDRAATWLAPLRAYAMRRARSSAIAESKGHYPAPLKALEAIATGLEHGMDAGLEAEARLFGELATGDVSHNLIALFLLGLAQRRAAYEGLPRGEATTDIAIVGAGLMGSGIAQAAAIGGATVRMRDVDTRAVGRGLDAVRKLTTDAARKRVIERRESARVISRVTGTTDYSGFRRADLVIEAVFEDIAVKRNVIKELEDVVRDDAVIATNTSALAIADIARDARRPERIVGMHFFSPVHRMPLVEVVRPDRADPAALARVVAEAHAMGKTAIVVRDTPGFYTTRVLGFMLAEAMLLLEEGARIEDIDRAMVAFGWPIGPLALTDEVGLVVARHVGETVAAARGITNAPSAVQRLTDAGMQGKRNGRGFYRYDGRKRIPNADVYALIGMTPGAQWHGEESARRLTLLFVNEAARCLDEGVLRSSAEGDLGAVMGVGFPPFLGGPFRWADTEGAVLRDDLKRLAERHGERYLPATSLAKGRRFYA
ncbi:MAG TPA: 3-hydroxyacyl-CoA dehydrogenase NAD-binding domain-containing protein [Candidatus Limnocylindria bacterium]|nr:3-hydroxyacyl-CoA dehydrogenase NAD-binding domain-containing protein [Candidatus Limnocylindria bacterium]